MRFVFHAVHQNPRLPVVVPFATRNVPRVRIVQLSQIALRIGNQALLRWTQSAALGPGRSASPNLHRIRPFQCGERFTVTVYDPGRGR